MKKFLILALCSCLFADEIDEIISKLNNKRESNLDKTAIKKINSPMLNLVVIDKNDSNEGNKTIVKPKEESFSLGGIMNDSAFINGKWVKIGQKVGNYTLVDIMDDSVYLKDGKKEKLIFFTDKLNKIKIKLGR